MLALIEGKMEMLLFLLLLLLLLLLLPLLRVPPRGRHGNAAACVRLLLGILPVVGLAMLQRVYDCLCACGARAHAVSSAALKI